MGREDMRKPAISAGNGAFQPGYVCKCSLNYQISWDERARLCRRSFFMLLEAPERAQNGGGGAGRMWGPMSPKPL